MIDLVLDRLKCTLYFRKIKHPAAIGIDGTVDVNRDAVAVSVQPSTFMSSGNIWEPMRRFDRELLEDFHIFH